jgi:hypothetical protein
MKKILLFLLLFACVSSKVPDWYVNSEQNTDAIIYGVGSSANREQAIEDALSNLKERVYTSVSSKKFIQDIVVNEQISNEYVNNVKLKTPNIPISNYKVTKIEEKNGTFYAMVQVEKQKLGEVINEMLNENTEELKSEFAAFNNTPDIVKKVFIIDGLYEKCVKHFEIERFYTSLGYLYPDNTCTEAVKTRYNLAVEHPVQIVNSNAKLFPVIVNIFAKKFNITETNARAISYKTDIKTEDLNNGNYITGISMDIMQYGVAKIYTIKCVGNSTVSKDAAIDAAITNCVEKSKKQSFQEFFTE